MRGFFWNSLIFLSIWVGIVSGGLILIQGCSQEKKEIPYPGKNVILISIDTCRADHVQPYSDSHAQTPTIKKLADEGVWFADAVTPVPLTLPAHCSLMTGLPPILHGVRSNFNYVLNDHAVTLAELFQESGYATAGMVGSIVISRREGMSQGFDEYDDRFTLEEFQSVQPSVERRAEKVIASATAWLQQHQAAPSPAPFFLFLHFYDPHMIYQPPAPFDVLYAANPYDGEIAYVDQCIGTLVRYLQSANLYDDLLIVVVGDHGEGLGDHGEKNHGLFLYEEALRIPWILKLPKNAQRKLGVSLQQSVCIEDVMPTLIDLCGLGPVPTTGMSLEPWIMNDVPVQPRNIVIETQYPMVYNWSPLYALRNSTWKYVHAPLPELFNLVEDPKEKNNLYHATDTPLSSMQSELESELIHMADTATLDGNGQVSSERMEVLASLGYAAGGSTTGIIAPDKPLPDPKQKLDVYNWVDSGLSFLARGFNQNAIDLFRRAQGKDPENPTPYLNLGLAYARNQEWEKAIENTLKAIELSPQNLLAHLQLTRIYVLNNQLEEGKKRLTAILKEFPKSAEAHYQLGELFSRQQDYPAALQEFELAKQWMPDMPGIEELIAKTRKNING